MKKALFITLFLSLFTFSNHAYSQELTPEQRKEVTDFLLKMGGKEEKIKNMPEEKLFEAYGKLQEMKENPIFQHMQKKIEEEKKAKEGINDVEYAKNLEINKIKVRYFNDREYIGTNNVKIKNKGDKIVKRVEFIFYFKDKDGNIIYEEKKGFIDSDKPLKPNYIYQFPKGRFSSFDNVPSEWQEGSVEYKIKDIILE